MSKRAFLILLKELLPKIQNKRKRKTRDMKPEIKLSITLRFFAGANMLDLSSLFHFDYHTCHRVKRQVIHAILSTNIGRPNLLFNINNLEYFEKKSRLWSGLRTTNPLSFRCIGALDGIAIPIIKPPAEDFPKSYSNRKGFYALVCQGICDAENRYFISFYF
jgi:hypothetical protein